MTSFSYNTDDFPPLSSNKSSHQSTTLAYLSVKPRERNSKAVSFSNTVNPLLLEKISLYLLLKRIFFLFNQMIFSSVILGLLFCHVDHIFVQKSGPSYACSFSVPLYVTVKTFVIILYVVIPSVLVVVKFKVLVNLHTLLLVHLIVS